MAKLISPGVRILIIDVNGMPVIPDAVSTPTIISTLSPPDKDWILANGIWDDSGIWIDTESWID